MAALENRTGDWAISFRYGGKKYNRSRKTKSKRAANELRKTLWRIEQGLLAVPDDAEFVSFLMSSGNVAEQPKAPESVPLNQLFAEYTDAVSESLEPSTAYTIGVHTRHLLRILGTRFDARTLELSDLDSYVTARRKEKTTRQRSGPFRVAQYTDPMHIPHTQLSSAALRSIVEEFVTRDGTDHSSVQRRIENVLGQLHVGGVELHFDDETQTCNILPVEECPPAGSREK